MGEPVPRLVRHTLRTPLRSVRHRPIPLHHKSLRPKGCRDERIEDPPYTRRHPPSQVRPAGGQQHPRYDERPQCVRPTQIVLVGFEHRERFLRRRHLHRREVEHAQPGTVPREVHERVERG